MAMLVAFCSVLRSTGLPRIDTRYIQGGHGGQIIISDPLLSEDVYALSMGDSLKLPASNSSTLSRYVRNILR